MKYAVFNKQGEETENILLPKEIFELKLNQDLVYQVAVSQMKNRRQSIAKTKNRGEVSGGGKKPWKQKGLGKARHGSIRSPIWRHGGVTFGPNTEKVYKRVIPRKIRRAALFMILASKARENFLILLDELEVETPKTKLIAKIIENLKLKIKDFKEGSIIIALPKLDQDLIRASRNLSGVKTVQTKELNCLDLLNSKYLLMPKESIKVIKETFLKQ